MIVSNKHMTTHAMPNAPKARATVRFAATDNPQPPTPPENADKKPDSLLKRMGSKADKAFDKGYVYGGLSAAYVVSGALLLASNPIGGGAFMALGAVLGGLGIMRNKWTRQEQELQKRLETVNQKLEESVEQAEVKLAKMKGLQAEKSQEPEEKPPEPNK